MSLDAIAKPIFEMIAKRITEWALGNKKKDETKIALTYLNEKIDAIRMETAMRDTMIICALMIKSLKDNEKPQDVKHNLEELKKLSVLFEEYVKENVYLKVDDWNEDVSEDREVINELIRKYNESVENTELEVTPFKTDSF